MEFHAEGWEVVLHRYQVAQAAAQPVELPHDQRVTGSKRPETPRKGRALGVFAGQSLALENTGRV
jgi:hypothetical protein